MYTDEGTSRVKVIQSISLAGNRSRVCSSSAEKISDASPGVLSGSNSKKRKVMFYITHVKKPPSKSYTENKKSKVS